MRILLKLVLATIVLLLLAPVIPAQAADGDDPTSGGAAAKLAFGIGPARAVSKSQTADGRPYLNYYVTPGGFLQDQVALTNLGTKPVTLELYPADASSGDDGAFAIAAGDADRTGAGSWLQLKPKYRKVTVPPREGNRYGRVLVPFEATVPADATPGDHVAAIVASYKTTSTNTSGAKVTLDQRVGVRAYFQVSGALQPRLTVEDLQATYQRTRDARGQGTVTVSYTVHNTGNVRMNASQIVEVDPLFGSSTIARPDSLSELLPGAVVTVRQTVDDVPGWGRLTVKASVFPTPTDASVPFTRGFVQSKTTIWAVSWLLVGIALLVLLLLLGGALWWRRRRRKKRLTLVSGGGGDRSAKGNKGKRAARDKEPALQRRLGQAMAARTSLRLLALTLALGVGAGAVLAAPAEAASKPRSPWQIFTETNTRKNDPQGGYSSDQANAIIDGWWGHEDPHDGPTLFSAADVDSPDFFKAFGVAQGDYSRIGVAFVRTSADGSSEHPEVHDGELAGQAFEWFTPVGAFGNWAGNVVGADSVGTVSTQQEWDGWVAAGSPSVDYDDDLRQMLPLVDGTPPAQHPSGASVLRRWPAGERISMVYFTIAGWDAHTEPIVQVGPDGHAITAWMTFRTVASPSQSRLRTSAGYRVLDVPAGFGVNTIARVDGKPVPKPGSTASAGTSAGAQPSAGASDAPSARGGATTAAPSPGQAGAADRSSDRGGIAAHGWAAAGGGLLLLLLVVGAAVVALRASRRTRTASGNDISSSSDSDRSLTGR
jgi:hypothetical protein